MYLYVVNEEKREERQTLLIMEIYMFSLYRRTNSKLNLRLCGHHGVCIVLGLHVALSAD